jgi:hypothetical protein
VKRFIFATLIGVLVLLGCGVRVLAQTNSSLSGVAQNTEVADDQSKIGDILTVGGDGLRRSTAAYDNKVYGVIVDAPIISVDAKTDKTKAVVTAGNAKVRVSNSNGNIALGDFITSSTVAGVGQKATESGYVLGKALDKFEGGNENLIAVLVERGYAQIGALKNNGPSGFFGSLVSDVSRLRASLAALVAVLVLAGGVLAFVRVVNSGVVAIGRNPLARSTIIRGMLISGTVVVLIMAAGLGSAVAIIILGK